jgi:sugar/nucleoside kinase (ribokinase family)
MISGNDIGLETLDEIRMETAERRTPVYFDVHSLTLGVLPDGRRDLRPVELWRRWLFMLHAVQMNEAEAGVLTGGQYDRENLVKQIVSLGTRHVVVTGGASGATFYAAERKHPVATHLPAELPGGGRAADPTGCGDVFGAAYCAHFAAGGDALASVAFAVRVAGAKAAMSGPEELGALSQFNAGRPA